jgi:N-acetylglucosamine-6-sulfatase
LALNTTARDFHRIIRAPRRYRCIVALILIWATILLTSTGEPGVADVDGGREGTGTVTPRPKGRPNVILILADDLDKSVFSRTTLDSVWADEGASFSNAFDTTSLCCPSRASILRGQYAHNTGLVNNDNSEPDGGAKYFRKEGLDRRTLATLLKAGGYETWFGGKYLNGYEAAGGFGGYVPPGWDSWQAYLGASQADVDGRTITFRRHYTDWLSARASRFIGRGRDASKPFFMEIAPLDTHEPLLIPTRHARAYPKARAPRPPSFEEEDVSDKPRWVRNQPPLDAATVAAFDRKEGLRMRSALTLEDLSKNVVAALKRAHRLDDTYLIFTSDNGYQMGLHGIRAGKNLPYTEAHEVPFVVRGPGVPAGASVGELVANIDIAPTVLDLAGVERPGWMDGRSFRPFLGGDAPEAWRDSLLVEGVRSGSPRRPAYSGVRHRDKIYVRYESGEEEYYDLRKDPYQLESRPQDAPASLKGELEALKNCAGEGCRRADGRL